MIIKIDRITGNENIRNNNGGEKLGDKFFFSMDSSFPILAQIPRTTRSFTDWYSPVVRLSANARTSSRRMEGGKKKRIRIIGREREARNRRRQEEEEARRGGIRR